MESFTFSKDTRMPICHCGASFVGRVSVIDRGCLIQLDMPSTMAGPTQAERRDGADYV
jgi:hypothetical protein